MENCIAIIHKVSIIKLRYSKSNEIVNGMLEINGYIVFGQYLIMIYPCQPWFATFQKYLTLEQIT